MSKTNSQVAQAFVMGGKVCKGSNTVEYDRMEFPASWRQVRTFTSYSTVVAVITEGTLWWKDYPSNSTQRQLSYVRSAWQTANAGTKALSICVAHPLEGASDNNVANYVVQAEDTLQDLLKPRIRASTKVALWDKFLRWVDRTELLLTMPCYSSSPSTTVMKRMDTLRRIRDSNASNPVGLDTIITNVRAIHELEGK